MGTLSENVLRCIKSINESMHELRTYKQFSGRTINFWWMELNDKEIKMVYEKVAQINDDFIMEHSLASEGITFSFSFK